MPLNNVDIDVKSEDIKVKKHELLDSYYVECDGLPFPAMEPKLFDTWYDAAIYALNHFVMYHIIERPEYDY